MGALEDKVAVVTGGASGIGRATVRRLAAEGARVAVLDVDGERGAAVAAEVGGWYVPTDVAEPADWRAAVSRVEDEAGGIDLAFLNAGVTTGQPDITALTDEQYWRIMRPNVDGVVFGVRAVVPSMVRRGGGAIVATASLAGLIAYSPDPIYALTKHAVVGLVRALGPQLAEKGITINAVCPGMVDTPLVGDRRLAALREAHFPVMAPEDIAEAVLGRLTGTDTALPWVCQAGRPAVAYQHRRVPGPRAEGAEGMVPPAAMAGHDQIRPQAETGPPPVS
jgi:NAD(P)-dependent dehydrogenase (short-subunit alcohol dehydrogenase family)